MIRFGMGLMEIVEQLTRGFMKATGKQPGNLEKLKIQQEAIQRLKEMNKVVDMEGRAMDTTKPIIGGTQRGADLKSGIMKATGARPRQVLSEDEIRQKLLKNNEEGLASMKSKLDDPEKKAMGGRIGYAGGSKGKIVEGLLKALQNKFGKKAATTADKAPIPPKTLERDMFKTFDNRNPNPKRQLTDEEIEEYEMELGDTETWMNDGTVGEAEAALKNHREYMADIMRMKERGDFGDFSPSKLDNVNDEQIAAAVDDIFPTGDPKYDAEMASEALVENNPQIFGDNVLLDDLDDATRSKIYGAVYDVLSNNMAKMRELKKLSKPEKTLQSMKEGKGIDISDPEIADEFTRFMKEKDPKAYKELEQKIELSNFKTKDRKGNADGGRIGLKAGMTKRGFLKLMGSVGAGIGAAKSGIFSGFGKGAGKEVAKEVVQSAGSGTPPPYFFKLAEKIKTMGDDVTAKAATKDREVVTKFKDYELTEDVATGEMTIQRMKVLDDDSGSFYGNPLTEETYMSYKPGKGQMDETMKGKTPPDEYEEGTALLRSDREYAGDVVDESFKISDDVIEEAMSEAPSIKIKKASGGIARMLGE
jgi:hypothetical protein